MKKIITAGFFCFSLVVSGAGYAQSAIELRSESGMYRPISETKYELTSGSPYLNENFLPGEVVLADNMRYKSLRLRYDQVADEVYFMEDNGSINRFTLPVRSFIIYPFGKDAPSALTFVSGFPASEGTTPSSFYQVLVDGKARLFRRAVKKINSQKGYGSATSISSIQTLVSYYIVLPGETLPIKIKRDKKELLAIFSGKAAELEKFIGSGKIDLKKDDQLAAVVAHYNQLL